MSFAAPDLPESLAEPIPHRSGARAAIRPIALVTGFLLVLGLIGAFTVNHGPTSTDVVASSEISHLGAPAQAIPAAIAATSKLNAASFELSLRVDVTQAAKVTKASIDAKGSFDRSARTAVLHETSSLPNTPKGRSTDADVIVDDTNAYASGDALKGLLPAGKQYVKVAIPQHPGQVKAPSGRVVSPGFDPTTLLTALQGIAANATEVGTDSIRGVETKHERVSVDLAKLAVALQSDPQARQALGNLPGLPTSVVQPVDLWLDGDGHLRRLVIDVDLAKLLSGFGTALGSAGPTGTVSLRLDLFDLGQPVSVTVPPADQVADQSSLSKLPAQIGTALGGLARP